MACLTCRSTGYLVFSARSSKMQTKMINYSSTKCAQRTNSISDRIDIFFNVCLNERKGPWDLTRTIKVAEGLCADRRGFAYVPKCWNDRIELWDEKTRTFSKGFRYPYPLSILEGYRFTINLDHDSPKQVIVSQMRLEASTLESVSIRVLKCGVHSLNVGIQCNILITFIYCTAPKWVYLILFTMVFIQASFSIGCNWSECALSIQSEMHLFNIERAYNASPLYSLPTSLECISVLVH